MAKRYITSEDSYTVRQTVTMSDAVRKYLPGEEIESNRIRCPFHGGKDRNLHFSGKHYYCFVCHEGGDVIKFVRKLFNLSFAQAMRKLNDDFNIGLDFDRHISAQEQREVEKRIADRQNRIEMDRYELSCNQSEYECLCDLIRLTQSALESGLEPFSIEMKVSLETLITLKNALARNQADYEEIWGRLRGET